MRKTGCEFDEFRKKLTENGCTIILAKLNKYLTDIQIFNKID